MQRIWTKRVQTHHTGSEYTNRWPSPSSNNISLASIPQDSDPRDVGDAILSGQIYCFAPILSCPGCASRARDLARNFYAHSARGGCEGISFYDFVPILSRLVTSTHIATVLWKRLFAETFSANKKLFAETSLQIKSYLQRLSKFD